MGYAIEVKRGQSTYNHRYDGDLRILLRVALYDGIECTIIIALVVPLVLSIFTRILRTRITIIRKSISWTDCHERKPRNIPFGVRLIQREWWR